MCRLSRKMGASTSWNPKALSIHLQGLIYLLLGHCTVFEEGTVQTVLNKESAP